MYTYEAEHGQYWYDNKGWIPYRPIYCDFEKKILALSNLEGLGYLPILIKHLPEKTILNMKHFHLNNLVQNLIEKYDYSSQDLENKAQEEKANFSTFIKLLLDQKIANTMEWTGKNTLDINGKPL